MFQQLMSLTVDSNTSAVYTLLSKQQHEYTLTDAEGLAKALKDLAPKSDIIFLDTVISLLKFWEFNSSSAYDSEKMQAVYEIAFTENGYKDNLNDIVEIVAQLQALYADDLTPSYKNTKQVYEQLSPILVNLQDEYLRLATYRILLNETLNFPFDVEVRDFIQMLARNLNDAPEQKVIQATEIAMQIIK